MINTFHQKWWFPSMRQYKLWFSSLSVVTLAPLSVLCPLMPKKRDGYMQDLSLNPMLLFSTHHC